MTKYQRSILEKLRTAGKPMSAHGLVGTVGSARHAAGALNELERGGYTYSSLVGHTWFWEITRKGQDKVEK